MRGDDKSYCELRSKPTGEERVVGDNMHLVSDSSGGCCPLVRPYSIPTSDAGMFRMDLTCDELLHATPGTIFCYLHGSGIGPEICVAGVHWRWKRTLVPCDETSYTSRNGFSQVSA